MNIWIDASNTISHISCVHICTFNKRDVNIQFSTRAFHGLSMLSIYQCFVIIYVCVTSRPHVVHQIHFSPAHRDRRIEQQQSDKQSANIELRIFHISQLSVGCWYGFDVRFVSYYTLMLQWLNDGFVLKIRIRCVRAIVSWLWTDAFDAIRSLIALFRRILSSFLSTVNKLNRWRKQNSYLRNEPKRFRLL